MLTSSDPISKVASLVQGVNFKLPLGGHFYIAGNKAVQFEDATSLDLAIANALINQTEPLTGKEFRFLRQQIGMSQSDVASFMHVDPQSVARWEKGQVSLPFANEAVMRFIYSSYQEKDAKIYPMLETMKAIDKAKNSRLELSFDKQRTHWMVNQVAETA